MKKLNVLEIVGYIALAICIVGNLIVGYHYLIAEILFLVSNVANTVRCFILKQPMADKVRNLAFVIMTIGLLIAWIK